MTILNNNGWKDCNKTRDEEITWHDLTSGCMIRIIIIWRTCLNDGFWNSITSKIPKILWLLRNLIAITGHNCRFTRTNRTWIRRQNKAQFQMRSETWFRDWKLYFCLKNTTKYISKIWFSPKRFDCSFNSIYLNPF